MAAGDDTGLALFCLLPASSWLFAAMALLHDDAEWAVNDIIDWDRYFAALRPALEE